jgi:acetyl-CoA C-acetyltransferase
MQPTIEGFCMKKDDIVIVAAKRTPAGALLGSLSSLSAPELGAAAHQAVLKQANINPEDIDEVISGCVLQAGIGQAPARQAAIAAGIPYSKGATTINKMCGSGMKSVMLAHDLIKAQSARIVLAGGMESMSNAPYLLDKARTGYRLGHGEIKDHLFLDGLEDAYEQGKLMGYFAENTAQKFNFSREAQDEYAYRSMEKALAAQDNGLFFEEITPLIINSRQGELLINKDEGPDPAKLGKLSKLKPVFVMDGTVTAGNSSSISDGAASLLIMTLEEAERRKLKPLAKIAGHASFAQKPQWFTTAPASAIKKLLEKLNWRTDDVDLYEINEAFAVVALAAIDALELDSNIVNVHGGACALGHPIGASGARILVTLLYALRQQGKKRGIASLCIGGGEATAMGIELL